MDTLRKLKDAVVGLVAKVVNGVTGLFKCKGCLCLFKAAGTIFVCTVMAGKIFVKLVKKGFLKVGKGIMKCNTLNVITSPRAV